MSSNPISTRVDFSRSGIQHGFLTLPYSRNDSAWGSIMMPITVMQRGEGPTALITGGNHGDEYEGPIALFNFAARENIDDFNGRVIIIPAMNYPAFQVGHRVSPIDNLNLNRIFPGRHNGSVTQVIADYFTNTLLPMADYVLDIHSGGKTLDFVPFVASHRLDDPQLDAACEAAASSFRAPYQLKMLEINASGLYDTQVESMGKVFVTTELGGAGTTTPYSIEIARRGIDNFLVHCGISKKAAIPAPEESIKLDMPDDSCYLFSEHSGLLEPVVMLGDRVKKGDLMARIHNIERTAAPVCEYHAQRDGLVLSRHVPSLVKMGDCLNVIAEVVP